MNNTLRSFFLLVAAATVHAHVGANKDAQIPDLISRIDADNSTVRLTAVNTLAFDRHLTTPGVVTAVVNRLQQAKDKPLSEQGEINCLTILHRRRGDPWPADQLAAVKTAVDRIKSRQLSKDEEFAVGELSSILPRVRTLPPAGPPPYRMFITVPPNETFTIDDNAIYFNELELNDGSVVKINPTQRNVIVACGKLTLHGRSTIDLTPVMPPPPKPPPAGPEPPQATGEEGPGTVVPGGAIVRRNPRTGADGPAGSPGQPGADAVGLVFLTPQVVATDGSLWIKTDGTLGGPGGDGVKGGKGASGPKTAFSNPDGGYGGGGGAGGPGGRGGNTASVLFKVGNDLIRSTQANGFSPSSRPPSADTPGTIVISGAPGAGGPGGNGGEGGDGGEGHEGSGPFTSDSKAGPPGGHGNPGPNGPPGNFVP